MGFTTGDLPPVDVETFADRPYFERIRVLATHWAEYGFGTPKMVHTIYVAKLLLLYVFGGVLVATSTSGLGPFWHVRTGGPTRSSTKSSSCGPCCSRPSVWPDHGGRWPPISNL